MTRCPLRESYVNFEKLREHNSVFSELAGNTRHELTLTGVGDPSSSRLLTSRQKFSQYLQCNHC